MGFLSVASAPGSRERGRLLRRLRKPGLPYKRPRPGEFEAVP